MDPLAARLLAEQGRDPLPDDLILSRVEAKHVDGDAVLAIPDPRPDRRVAFLEPVPQVVDIKTGDRCLSYHTRMLSP